MGAGTLQLAPQAQFTAAKWNEALTLFEKGGKIKVSNKHLDAKHTFWTFPNGGHLVVRHDEENNWLQADFSPWRPRLFAQFTAAVPTYFARAFPLLGVTMTQSPAPIASLTAEQASPLTHLLFDFDDTVTWDGQLPEPGAQALYRAAEAGFRLIAVTGRSAAWAKC